MNEPRILCAQLGARDHYGFAEAFQRSGCLELLLTDYWQKPGSVGGRLVPRLAGRFNKSLAVERVLSSNLTTLASEAAMRLRGLRGWEQMIHRNAVYQAAACRQLGSLIPALPPLHSGHARQAPHSSVPLREASAFRSPITLFSYSYAARDLFRLAKRRGWLTILGQIDPGPAETRRIETLARDRPEWHCPRIAPPPGYYDDWREELELADRVIVNSEWSREALLGEGVDPAKLEVVPIPYAGRRDNPARTFPAAFDAARPLRLLFLGQVNLRKGIAELLEAMAALAGAPVELWVVGQRKVEVPESLRNLPALRWHGQVPRQQVEAYFRDADVFILPTHSDGFGLTQLEALDHRMPVIVSKNCARLVEDGVTGRVLEAVSAAAIERALRGILADPACLPKWSAACKVPERCTMDAVAARMLEIAR